MKRHSKKVINKARLLYIKGKSQRKIGMILKISQKTIYNFVKDIPLNKREKLPPNCTIKHKIPNSAKQMSKEKARLLAYFAAEGYIATHKIKSKHIYFINQGTVYRNRKYIKPTISFCNGELSVIKRFLKDFKKVYKLNLKYNKKRREVMCWSIETYKDLTRYGKYKSSEWTIPLQILKNKQFRQEWLKAFCDGEAHINNNIHKNIIISSINIKGLNTIKEKILKPAKIKCYINGPYNNCFRLKISRKDNLIKFKNNFGFYHKQKDKQLTNLINFLHTQQNNYLQIS